MAREKLKKYRISINKTQEEMAKIWGITLSFYKQIECGAKNPSIQKIKDFEVMIKYRYICLKISTYGR